MSLQNLCGQFPEQRFQQRVPPCVQIFTTHLLAKLCMQLSRYIFSFHPRSICMGWTACQAKLKLLFLFFSNLMLTVQAPQVLLQSVVYLRKAATCVSWHYALLIHALIICPVCLVCSHFWCRIFARLVYIRYPNIFNATHMCLFSLLFWGTLFCSCYISWSGSKELLLLALNTRCKE